MAFVIKQNSFFRFDKKSGGSSVEERRKKPFGVLLKIRSR